MIDSKIFLPITSCIFKVNLKLLPQIFIARKLTRRDTAFGSDELSGNHGNLCLRRMHNDFQRTMAALSFIYTVPRRKHNSNPVVGTVCFLWWAKRKQNAVGFRDIYLYWRYFEARASDSLDGPGEGILWSECRFKCSYDKSYLGCCQEISILERNIIPIIGFRK